MQKILFITGSGNQTSQMHQIANELSGFDCWFSQLFTDSPVYNYLLKKTTWLNSTVLGGQFKLNAERYLIKHQLQIDYGAKLNKYDLIVYCSDLIIPKRLREYKTIWVQEGMIDKATLMTHIVKAFKLPPSLTGNTSLNGTTNVCDIYCAASAGYKSYFAKSGTDMHKIVVTGMPNYDDLAQCRDNDFPHHGYVMVATSDMRETYRYEDRPGFIKKAVVIANGRQLLFKLHPNEDVERAKREIARYAPAGTLVYNSGNTNQMIANCNELITQYSTVVYTGIILGKKVHSWFDVGELKKLAPVQNQGTSARTIAALCRSYLAHKGSKESFKPAAALAANKQEHYLAESMVALS